MSLEWRHLLRGVEQFWRPPRCLVQRCPTNQHQSFFISYILIVTGPPTHTVGNSIVWLSGICRRLSHVVVCNTPRRCICNVTHQGAARDGGPVVLRPVRATPCYLIVLDAVVCTATSDMSTGTLSNRIWNQVSSVNDRHHAAALWRISRLTYCRPTTSIVRQFIVRKS